MHIPLCLLKLSNFLDRLGINNQTSRFTERDLSPLYRTAPLSQGKSAACVGFAFASDMEFELYKTQGLKAIESISPWSVYATLRYLEEGQQRPDCLEMNNLSDVIEKGAWIMDTGIKSFDNLVDTPFCLTSSEDTWKHIGYVSIKNIEEYSGDITFSLLKQMIDHGNPPVLLIRSDAREETEGWINIIENGGFMHVLVVVGYGINDIDPFTLREGPYFLVRDSLASQPIHYKISAKNLLDHSLEILKITQLEISRSL